MSRAFSRFIFCLALILVVCAIAFFQVVAYFSRDLPDYRKIAEYDPAIISRVYSNAGDVIAEYANERRIYVKYDKIPKVVINAFLAAEDKNFFQHQGIDLFSIARAGLQSALNIATNRRMVGGSTITQQVVKSLLLDNKRTISRKIKEAILAYRISHHYSKEQILELYLNKIFLGNHTYGIAAAALGYFGKELQDIEVPEAAMLAALPKAPSSLNPFLHYAKAKARRDWVIRRMAEDGAIEAAEIERFVSTEIALYTDKLEHQESKEGAYVDVVKKELVELFGEEALYSRGLVVNTYLDATVQQKLEKAFKKGIDQYDSNSGWRGSIAKFKNISNWALQLRDIKKPVNAYDYEVAVVTKFDKTKMPVLGFVDGSTAALKAEGLRRLAGSVANINAQKFLKVGDVVLVSKNDSGAYFLEQLPDINGGMVALEPYTGRVLAIVGGYDNGYSTFNRAVQAKRQPGSAFKPFVYLSALLEGYQPNAMLLDGPMIVPQGPGLPDWKPKNITERYRGMVTLRSALESSINLPTIRVVLEVGVQKVLELAKTFSIYDNPKSYHSIALGAAETTLLNLSNAYNTFASDGVKTKPRFIDSVYDQNGELLYQDYDVICQGCNSESDKLPEVKYSAERLLEPAVNYQMVSLLNGVIQRGTGARAQVLHKTLAGKTGTTNKNFDAWFIGFTPYVTVGSYVGYDNPKSMGKNATGATIALPIFVNFMQDAVARFPDVNFAVPEGVYFKQVYRDTGLVVDEQDAVDQNSATIFEVFRDSGEISEKKFANEEYMQHQKSLKAAESFIGNIIDSLEE